MHEGRFAAAQALIEETDAISQVSETASVKYAALLLAAWRGDYTKAMERFEPARRDGTARGEGMGLGVLGWAMALLHNGRGHHGEALEAAQQACEYEDVGSFGWALAELIEAAVREGRPDEAAAALARLSERTRASGTDWALGVEAGARALVHDDEAAYRESVERLAATRATLQLARSRLLYGEWLRRENRRVDAREQLRAAHDAFSDAGAEAFAERARRELQATGETARRRDRRDPRRADATGVAGRPAGP